MRFVTQSVSLLLLIVLVAGCGSKVERPPTATVRGTVKLKGKPVMLATVIFAPVGGGQSSSGETGPTGEYELVFRQDHPGAQIGKHRVTISTFRSPEVGDDGKSQGGHKETIPREYNVNSTLEKEVVAGDNVIDFDL